MLSFSWCFEGCKFPPSLSLFSFPCILHCWVENLLSGYSPPIMQSSFACFFSGCAYNILHDFGECCESVPLDHTGSYISSSINITKILACVVQVDAFYCKSLSWLHLHCNGSWFSSKLCISCVKLEY